MKQVNIGCIYLITNTINNKKYVGKTVKYDYNIRFKEHIRDAFGKHKNSKIPFYFAIRKYGKEYFKIELLCRTNHKNLLRLESYYAEQFCSYIWDFNPGGYNLRWCGDKGMEGHKHSLETKQKMSIKLKGRICSIFTRQLISKTHRGKKISNQHKQILREKMLAFWTPERRKSFSEKRKNRNFKHSEESKRIMSEKRKGHEVNLETRELLRKANLGKKHTEESKAKMSESRKGKKHSPEFGAKISASKIGKKHSEEAKAKMSASRKGKPASEAVITAALKSGAKRFDEVFQKRFPEFQKDPSSKESKKWIYSLNAKRRKGRLEQKYIDQLRSVSGWSGFPGEK